MTRDTYYILSTVNRLIFELELDEADRVATVLDSLHDAFPQAGVQAAELMFVHFTDASGADVRVRAAHIEAFYLSSPTTRAADQAAREDRKSWDDDA